MGYYKVGDRVKVVRADLDIFGKTATVTAAAPERYGSDCVLVALDNPDKSNPSQIGSVSLREAWLTSLEGN